MTTTLTERPDPRDMEIAGFRLTAIGLQAEGDPSFEQWTVLGQYLERCDSAVAWWVADFLNYADDHPEWKDEAEQIISTLYGGRSDKTLANLRAVGRAYDSSRRREQLSFSHHADLASQPEHVQDELLDWCEPDTPDKPPRPRSELRKELKRRREQEREPLELWLRRYTSVDGLSQEYQFLDSDENGLERLSVEFFERFSGVSLVPGECVRLVGFEMRVEKE